MLLTGEAREMSLRKSSTIVDEPITPAAAWEQQDDSVAVLSPRVLDAETSNRPVAALSRKAAKLLPLCQTPQSPMKLMQQLGLSDRKNFRKAYLRAAWEAGVIERTIPDMPHSNQQRYRLTEKGRRWLERFGQ